MSSTAKTSIITFPLCVCVCQSVGPLSVAAVSVQKVIGKWIYYVVAGQRRVMDGICICFLRKSKGPSSSEKGNRTTPFDVHPYIHNKICNILYPIPLVIIIMYMLYVRRNSRPSRGRRRSFMFETNLTILLLCLCVRVI